MRLFEIGIQLRLYRTVAVPDEFITDEETLNFLNGQFVTNDSMIEAINDDDYEIEDFFCHEVGNK